MHPTDTPVLRDRLSELAEVFERKPVTEKALGVWFDVLRDFPIQSVAGVLIGWPKTHSKFPAPADVWKIVSEIRSNELEAKAAAERAQKAPFHPGVGGRQAEAFLAQMRATLKKPAWSPRQHWERVLERSAPDSIGHRYAAAALLALGSRSNREPGEDDEMDMAA